MEHNTKSELRKQQQSASQFCIICLDTDEEHKMYPANTYNLGLQFTQLTGISLKGVPQFCTECAQRLSSCCKFRSKCLTAHQLLRGLVERHTSISIQKIRAISRKEYQLTSNISKKAYKANHTDVYLIDITDCNTQENDDKTDVYLIDTTDCYTQENDEKTEINIDSKKLDPVLDKDGEVLDDNFIDEVFVKSDVESLNDDIDIDIFDDTDDFQTLPKDLDNDKEEKQIIDNIQPLKIKDNDVKKTVETTYESTDEIKSIQTMNDDFDNDDDFLDYDIDMSDDSDYIDRETNKEKYLSNNNITNSETTLNAVKEINSAIKSNNNTFDDEDEKKIVRENVYKKTPMLFSKIDVDLSNQFKKLFKIIALTHAQQIAEIQKRKDSDNFKKSKFICSVCFKGFQTSDLYKDHMLRHTDKFGSLECSICRIRVKSTLQLSQHEYIHRIMFRCRKCPFQTCHKSVADRHRRSHFGGAHKCSKCDFECREHSRLMVHKRVKHPSDFACPHCGYSLNSKAGLTQHFTKKHIFEDTQNLDGPLCEPCNIRFASERAYTLHMKVSPKHTPADERQRNYQPQNSSWIDCALCDIKLKGFKLYAKHFEAKHPDQPPPTRSKRKAYKYTSYKSKANDMCEVCGRCFVGPLNLREHMQQHTGVMMYQCDICDKTFMKKPSLRGHIMLKHTDPTSKHTDKFQCRVCCKVISTFGNLQRHMVVHQAVRPSYQCNVCGKSFTTNAAMQSHVAHVHHHVPWPKRVNRKRTRAKQRHSSDIEN